MIKQLALVVIMSLAFTTVSAQSESKQLVRLAKLVIDPNQVEQYKAFLKEEAEESVRLEPGVLTLYAAAVKVIEE